MTASPVLALRRASRAALLADPGLVAALGGPNVFDEAPPRQPPPYVTFGDASSRDWSASLSSGDEQQFVVTVWSGARGVREALDIAARIVALLSDASLTLSGHRLIDLSYVALATRREQHGRFARADVRFRATTEIL